MRHTFRRLLLLRSVVSLALHLWPESERHANMAPCKCRSSRLSTLQDVGAVNMLVRAAQNNARTRGVLGPFPTEGLSDTFFHVASRDDRMNRIRLAKKIHLCQGASFI